MGAFKYWKPGRRVLFWARASVFFPLAIMLIGSAFVPVSLQIVSGAVFVAVLVGLFATYRFWRELGKAEEIPLEVRRRLRQSVLFFGTVVVVQLLIYNRFPNSGFSGLRDLDN